jgi:hypothetical protein
MEADGSFVAINTRISQSVPHLHAHVVPRWKKDGFFARGFIWKRQPYEDHESIVTVQHQIRAAVFLADPCGHYLGRTCPWKACAPGLRLRGNACHCGRRP